MNLTPPKQFPDHFNLTLLHQRTAFKPIKFDTLISGSLSTFDALTSAYNEIRKFVTSIRADETRTPLDRERLAAEYTFKKLASTLPVVDSSINRIAARRDVIVRELDSVLREQDAHDLQKCKEVRNVLRSMTPSARNLALQDPAVVRAAASAVPIVSGLSEDEHAYIVAKVQAMAKPELVQEDKELASVERFLTDGGKAIGAVAKEMVNYETMNSRFNGVP